MATLMTSSVRGSVERVRAIGHPPTGPALPGFRESSYVVRASRVAGGGIRNGLGPGRSLP